MRALKPWLGQVLAVLLLMQWGSGLAACLDRMAWDPAQTLCHAAEPAPERQPGPDTAPMAAGCPVCAPLPPSLLPPLPEFPAPRPLPTQLGQRLPQAVAAVSIRLASPQQPRAPPVRS